MQQTGERTIIRRAAERGHTDWGWLDSRHTFSFGDYFDPGHMGFRALRVINDDRVAPGGGFGRHGHRDMEILSYVLEGALAHQDSMGTGSVIRPGEIQMMRAGTGVTHSEYNHSRTEPVHFLQIWIVPDRRDLAPAYAQRTFDGQAARAGFVLLASRDGRDGSVQVSQDVELRTTVLAPEAERTLEVGPSRHAWLHVARGAVALDGTTLGEGDGVAVSGPALLNLTGREESEVLAFDLG
ncbi:MAG TPA: pirin family protein [Vicinamibacteria bacterium]|nr:pirin family protein [Vicinamibacteria bacterium]